MGRVALALAKHLRTWQGGRLVINVVENPIKCPVAPLEFIMLADWFFHEQGIRDRVELIYATPLPGAFTKPICNEMLTGMLLAKGISVVANAPLATVTDREVACPDGKTVPYDLLVTIPPHEGSALIDDAGLGDGLGFGLTEIHTLKAKKAERVFLLGDNTNVPTSKAGSVAHFQAEVVVHNDEEAIKARLFENNFGERLRYSIARSPAYPEIDFINIVNPQVNKGEALKVLMEHYGYLPAEVIAIGDGLNDIPLLEAAGMAVAMGNAFPEVKQVSNYITLDIEQHGVAAAIDFFFPV